MFLDSSRCSLVGSVSHNISPHQTDWVLVASDTVSPIQDFVFYPLGIEGKLKKGQSSSHSSFRRCQVAEADQGKYNVEEKNLRLIGEARDNSFLQ